jgi:dienelactone hydrolase
VFDVELLSERLLGAVGWATAQPEVAGLPVGLFGASTGAAAALVAAAEAGSAVDAVVCRGGRVDLAGGYLDRVPAPTLLIVGSRDAPVIALNRRAAAELRCVHQVAVVRGAGHVFEEPGALEAVAALAGEWFGEYLHRHALSRDVPLAETG